MESPPYLFDQFAARHGLSKEMAKKSMLLKSYADEGKRLMECAVLVGISKSSAQRVARKLLIDFCDFRPYAGKEKKGEARPTPGQRDIARPAADLPLFA